MISRRLFLQASTAMGGLVVCGGLSRYASAADADSFGQLGFAVSIDPGNNISVFVPNPEMGQGVKTSLAMLIAEELDVDWGSIAVSTMPLAMTRTDEGQLSWRYVPQGSAGSNSIKRHWQGLRLAGASARDMLLTVAAQRLSVPKEQLFTSGGFVGHQESSVRLAYGELANEAASLPVPVDDVVPKSKDEFKIVGTPTKVVDAREIVTGKTQYCIDTDYPGMQCAIVVRAPQLGGRVGSYDPAPVLAQSGVTDVVTLRSNPPDQPYTIVADGVAIVADTFWHAQQAAQKLDVIWDLELASDESSKDLDQRCIEALRSPGQVIGNSGDFDTTFEDCDQSFERTYVFPLAAHATLEPQNCIVDVRSDGATVIGPMQLPSYATTAVAELTGLDRLDVDVRMTRIGGGFGRRLNVDYVYEAAMISKAVGTPIKVQWTREDDIRHDFYRPMGHHNLRTGMSSDGVVVGFVHRLASTSKYYRRANYPQDWMWRSELGATDFPARHVERFRQEYTPIESALPRGSWRAPRHTANAYAVETFLNELAEKLEKDPLQLRREILSREYRPVDPESDDDDYDADRLLGALELVARAAQWRPAYAPGPNRGRGIAAHYTFGSYCACVIDVEANSLTDFSVKRVFSSIDCGIVVNPLGLEAQMQSAVLDGLASASRLEINFDIGKVVEGNFDTYPISRMMDCPDEITCVFADSEVAPTGAGEPPLPPIAPALVAALHQATGQWARRLPLTKA